MVKEILENSDVALTYDDVRLKTGRKSADIMPSKVDLKTKFSRNIDLNIPIVSAAMDTVTEYKLAIEIAVLGGLGIIHKNMSAKEQADQVERVKFHLNGFIEKPICVYNDETIEQIINKKNEKGYGFMTFPVLDRNNKLVGILSGNDFDFCNDYSLPAKDVMTSNPITAEKGTSLDKAYKIMVDKKKKSIPLVDSEGKIAGFYTYTDVERIMTESSKTYNVDKNQQLKVGAAIGTGDEALERLEKLIQKHVDVVVLDSAHGDSNPVFETIKRIRRKYENIELVVGNISEPESAKRLAELGVDGIKVGQGPGSICTTRVVAGVGCPQVTAVYECAKVADEYNIPINADGGLRYSGDIPIAIGAGASSVMMGSMLAGTDESPGDKIFHNGRRWKDYRGMGSLGALEQYKGSRKRYNQEDAPKSRLVPEGVESLIPYKGPLKDVLFQYIGGLRKGMGYIGAENIEELRKIADFRRISKAGQKESHPHNVLITKETPNYQIEENQ